MQRIPPANVLAFCFCDAEWNFNIIYKHRILSFPSCGFSNFVRELAILETSFLKYLVSFFLLIEVSYIVGLTGKGHSPIWFMVIDATRVVDSVKPIF